MTRALCFLAAAGLLAGVNGCGSSDFSTVTGVVTLDGQPVGKASVTFVPDDDGGSSSTGYTDETGRFKMSTINPGDGVKRGKYKVLVSCTEPSEKLARMPGDRMAERMKERMGGPGGDPKAGAQIAKEAQKEMKEMREQARKAPPTKSLTPAVYADAAKTPLRVEVPTKGELKLELRSDAK